MIINFKSKGMNTTLFYTLSNEIQKLITNEQLSSEIGIKAWTLSKEMQNYFEETGNLDSLKKLLEMEEGCLCLNECVEMNDHLIIAIKSPVLENDKNICIFLVPSIISFKKESDEFIAELKEVFCNDKLKNQLVHDYQVAFAKCEIMRQVRLNSINETNIN